MGEIYEPLKSCRISLIYVMYGKEYDEVFTNVQGLKTYFHRFPPIAERLGYVEKRPRTTTGTHQENTTSANLYIEYGDRVVRECRLGFDNIKKFAQYLEDHPPIAKWLNYEKSMLD